MFEAVNLKRKRLYHYSQFGKYCRVTEHVSSLIYSECLSIFPKSLMLYFCMYPNCTTGHLQFIFGMIELFTKYLLVPDIELGLGNQC